MLPWYSAPTVMHGIFWMVIDHSGTFYRGIQPPRQCMVYFTVFYFLGVTPACVWCCDASTFTEHENHQTSNSNMKYSGEPNKRHVQITGRHSQPTGNDYKQELRPPMSTTSSPDQKPLSPLQTTVSYGIILPHGQKPTATSARWQFNTSILYTTKLQINRFTTITVFAIAPSTCATFSLHRAAAALLASMASWRALTSGMKILLSRRKISSRSTMPGEIELRRLSIRKERAEKFLYAWQRVDLTPLWYSQAMSAKYGRPASTSPVSAQVLALLLRSQNSKSEKSFSSR